MAAFIRDETPADAESIHALTKAAFLEARHASHTEHFIVDALREANALTVSLVAEEAGHIVGHVAISPITISDGSQNWYGLGPIAVHPDRQGYSIGSDLMHAALHRIEDLNAAGCVVLGNPEYYSRFGFKPQGSLVLPGARPEYFQAITFAGSLPHGTVAYHEAFTARD